jgi:hypothetical protein
MDADWKLEVLIMTFVTFQDWRFNSKFSIILLNYSSTTLKGFALRPA